MTKSELIETLAEYFCITDDIRSYDWQSGCTICGDNGEYRWLTLANIVDALEWHLEDEED